MDSTAVRPGNGIRVHAANTFGRAQRIRSRTNIFRESFVPLPSSWRCRSRRAGPRRLKLEDKCDGVDGHRLLDAEDPPHSTRITLAHMVIGWLGRKPPAARASHSDNHWLCSSDLTLETRRRPGRAEGGKRNGETSTLNVGERALEHGSNCRFHGRAFFPDALSGPAPGRGELRRLPSTCHHKRSPRVGESGGRRSYAALCRVLCLTPG